MKLSVIIVNYNVKYFLEQALLSVRKAVDGLAAEVFVVDNNSVDDSVRMVKEKFPEVILIANNNNPGFSIANNQAIRKSRGEYVLLLNPDTVVEEDTFSKCIQFMDAHPKAGGLGVRMIDGSGAFLPESKRGFPTPFVAFSKTFGLSKIFSKSKTFNKYHLGYLDEHENHEVEVLAGAFMWLRKSVLNEIGLLDETFFMYGEDIDLSYRIVKAGYKNYYFSDTSIIHYKGESTKKGSLNYVKTFYNAMIIFAKKHFEGEGAKVYIFMLKLAIYFRAFLTIASNFFKKATLPILDAVAIYVGIYFIKDFWAKSYYNDPEYYQDSFLYFNLPLYIIIWLSAVFFSGGYDKHTTFRRLARGLLLGTLILAAVYGFLDLAYRSSRVLIVLGAFWALISTIAIRFVIHFIKYKNLNVGKSRYLNLVIVGSEKESNRVIQLIHKAQVLKNFIGVVAPHGQEDTKVYLSNLNQLDEVVQIYKVEEIIFCSKDISSQEIIQWMSNLGPQISYKIVPEEGLSIIGSSSKDTSGELYTIDIRFQITETANRRNKRLLDVLLSLILIPLLPIVIFIVQKKLTFIENIFQVFWGKKSWVGYSYIGEAMHNLPRLKAGVLSTLDSLEIKNINEPTVRRLNFLYAKDYEIGKDLEIIWKGRSHLGNT